MVCILGMVLVVAWVGGVYVKVWIRYELYRILAMGCIVEGFSPTRE